MESIMQEIREYIAPNGLNPFREWLSSVEDIVLYVAIQKRMDRLRLGNLGDYRSLGGGLFELRVHYGPGYRVYFGQLGRTIVVLLCGGDKRSQLWDIKKAKDYWEDFKRRAK